MVGEREVGEDMCVCGVGGWKGGIGVGVCVCVCACVCVRVCVCVCARARVHAWRRDSGEAVHPERQQPSDPDPAHPRQTARRGRVVGSRTQLPRHGSVSRWVWWWVVVGDGWGSDGDEVWGCVHGGGCTSRTAATL